MTHIDSIGRPRSEDVFSRWASETTSGVRVLEVGDEVVAGTPVEHTHEHQDVNPFSMQAYSLAEIFAETIPELVEDPPALETVRKRLDAFLVKTLAPALEN